MSSTAQSEQEGAREDLPPVFKLPPPFDARAAWRNLSRAHQDLLGAAALILGCAFAGMDNGPLPTALGRACETAALSLPELFEAIYLRSNDRKLRAPDLNQVGIRMCSKCGCTDNCACDPPCSWIGATLCSACGQNDALAREDAP